MPDKLPANVIALAKLQEQKRAEAPVELEAEYHLTDLGNAKRLVALHGADLRYCHPFCRWFVWDGRRWSEDATAAVERLAKETVQAMYAEAASIADAENRKALVNHALRSEGKERLAAMLWLARSEPGIPVLPEELDRNSFLLNVANGTLDLRTGELRPHRREDLITRLIEVEYDPEAQCPLWLAFLDRIMAGNQQLIAFLQRAVGYCLTGDVSEQVLFLAYGTGANGKTVFLRTILNLLGPYGKPTDPELLLTRFGDVHPTGIADLMGARLAVVLETEEGRRLNETLTKWLTGGDRLKARKMRQDFFEFEPTHKIWIATNHKPTIRGTDYAIWRRIRLIPFNVTIPEDERDPHLVDKLRDELPGILAWAVRGCLAWLQDGLGLPEDVKKATQAYREEMDLLADFLAECCVLHPDAWTPAGELYKAYREWCERAGEVPLSQKAFALRLQERGLEPGRAGKKGTRIYRGIGLLSAAAEPPTRLKGLTHRDRLTDADGFPGINSAPICAPREDIEKRVSTCQPRETRQPGPHGPLEGAAEAAAAEDADDESPF